MWGLRWWHKFYGLMKLRQSEFNAFEYVILDLELTGLDAQNDEIVSVAWLMIERGKVHLDSSEYYINKEVQALSQSPIYHGIDEQMVEQGERLSQILTRLGAVLEGKILVCHNAQLDWAFLKQASKCRGLTLSPLAVLDTMAIEKRRLSARTEPLNSDSLTLQACRIRYHLPEYGAHNALTDALATAELLLAQASAINVGKRLKLGQLLQ
ncbi:3'-5' exonuclease [Pseudoalteromonas sp. MMG022]|uniref:3'-5' exonuclease n=1 Tax=Pseudoalteromonas sp. MMG022 TaxID=2909978 RepID=UPI001F361922|nr:3'-5' exonuclease [Pseudoalteromonas sp. MMG022]MCF6435286.1 3'-5' exonuclease [Pseudoalteromonas sp. MMG022]